jgi:DNA-binding MurR/RpiR family transcriptional regulator
LRGGIDLAATVPGVEVADRIRMHGSTLTSAERRVAEAILEAPQAVGFGTVAELAKAADVGAASVVRLATKLGFDGYTDLQHCIQRDLTQQLRPAAERIRTAGDESRGTHEVAEMNNVRATIEAADDESVQRLVERLVDTTRPVVIVTGEASAGVAQQFVSQLEQLRPGVSIVSGNEVRMRRELAVVSPAATAIVIDLRRYERWVLEAAAMLASRSIWTTVLTDGILSPLAHEAEIAFVVHAEAIGPFDSHVGTLALLNLIAANAALAMRSDAAERLAAIERAWSDHGALTDGR